MELEFQSRLFIFQLARLFPKIKKKNNPPKVRENRYNCAPDSTFLNFITPRQIQNSILNIQPYFFVFLSAQMEMLLNAVANELGIQQDSNENNDGRRNGRSKNIQQNPDRSQTFNNQFHVSIYSFLF